MRSALVPRHGHQLGQRKIEQRVLLARPVLEQAHRRLRLVRVGSGQRPYRPAWSPRASSGHGEAALVSCSSARVIALADIRHPEGGSSQPIDAAVEGDATVLDRGRRTSRAHGNAAPGRASAGDGRLRHRRMRRGDRYERALRSQRPAVRARRDDDESAQRSLRDPCCRPATFCSSAGYAGEGEPPLASAELYEAAHGSIYRSRSHVGRPRRARRHAAVRRTRAGAGGWVGRRTFTSTVGDLGPGRAARSPRRLRCEHPRAGRPPRSLSSGDVLARRWREDSPGGRATQHRDLRPGSGFNGAPDPT